MKTSLQQVCITMTLIYSTHSFALSVYSATPSQLVTELIDTSASNITYSNIKYSGDSRAAGTFSGGLAEGLGIERGIILTSGWISLASGPNRSPMITGNNGRAGDTQLNNLVSGNTLDAASLEFDFVPQGDKLEFKYVFASEEYNEWVGSPFNDVFAFFLNGKNIALIPSTNTFVAINSVNQWSYSNYYRNNPYPSGEGSGYDLSAKVPTPYYTQFDGFTTVLTATAKVVPQQSYRIKLVIADREDYLYDSAVFVQGKSFASPLPLPPAATLITPENTLCEFSPTYRWNAVATASHYSLQITDATGKLTKEWYSATQVGCGQGTGICSAQPGITLVPGTTRWQVVTYNSSGYGPASTTKSFVVKTAPPAPRLIAPSGTLLTGSQPTYSWEKVVTATDYLLQIKDSTGTLVETGYNYCPENPCTITPTVPLATAGTAQWQVQSRNECGTSWSEATILTIENPPPPPPMTCQLYAVHDQEIRDSQFFVVEPLTQTSSNRGTLHHRYDIEGLDAHPLTQGLYAGSGNDAQPPIAQGGSLYQVSTEGSLSFFSPLRSENGESIIDVSGLSFNPSTQSLWVSVPKRGLFEIPSDRLLPHATTAKLRWSSNDVYDDITWDETGTLLYLTSGNQIFTYQQGVIKPFCTLPKSRIESLEMTSDGTLLLGLHGKAQIYFLDLVLSGGSGQCVVQPAAEIPTIYNDIEGMAWICR